MSESVNNQSIVYSVVVPVFNSAPTLSRLFEEIKNGFGLAQQHFEVVFVNDFSGDSSMQTLLRIKEKYPSFVKVIQLAHNHGQHKATLCGIIYSSGKWIITLDDDLETPPSEISKLIKEMEKNHYDLVYGVPESGQQVSFKRRIGEAFKRLLSGGADTTGIGSSFRMFSGHIRENLKQVKLDFIFLDELLHWYVADVGFVPVKRAARIHGSSHYNYFSLSVFAVQILFNYSDYPIKLMIWSGISSSLLCFGLGIYHVYNKFMYDVQLGYTSLITSIFFSTGLILLSLGIIAEYLRKIYFKNLDRQNIKIKHIYA